MSNPSETPRPHGRPRTPEGIGKSVRVPQPLVPAVESLIAEFRRVCAQRNAAIHGAEVTP